MRSRVCIHGWLLLSLLSVAPAARCAVPPAGVDFQSDITYATIDGQELKLNLARPGDAKAALPCVVVIHGGAWRAGDRKAHNDLTWQFAQRGYVSATVSYRFCPKYTFPAQVQDVKCAVRFLRANAARYSIDPQRIGAVGFSAGAHLSMLLGTMDKADGLDDVGGFQDQSSKVSAVVAFFGPTDLLKDYPPVSGPLLRDFIGGTQQEKPNEHRRASPVTYVDAGDAEMLLLHGTNDPLVPWQQAIYMLEAMHKAGVRGRVELIAGAGHGWAGTELRRTVNAMFAFFDEHLKNPPGPATRATARP